MTTNAQIADHLRKIANLFLIKGDQWKSTAFARGADSVLSEQNPVVGDDGKVMKVDGIGKSLSNTILEFHNTGTSEKFASLAKEIDPDCLTMMRVKGIGPKTAYKFSIESGFKNFDALVEAWKAGKLDPRFDDGMKQAIETQGARVEYYKALGLADSVYAILQKQHKEEILRMQMCGSLRRKKPTIKDIDFVVSLSNENADTKPVIDTFCSLGKVINRGETKAAIWYTLGEITMQIDLLVVPNSSFGSAIQYFTGSKDHNIEVRGLAQKLGMKVNEYGIFKDEKKIGGENEEDIYNILEIPMPNPEDR